MSKNPEIKAVGTAFQSGSRAGENFVWLTSMGLAIGLTLVTSLLALILWEGLTVFWPQRVAVFQLVDGSTAGIAGKTTLAGEVVDYRTKVNHVIGKAFEQEYQLFVGNKDTYGFNFKFVDANAIKSKEYLNDYIVAERLENGRLIGVPVAIAMKDGSTIPANSPEFAHKLEEMVTGYNAQRAKILRIEKYRIGDINYEMEGLRLQEKGVRRRAAGDKAKEEAGLAPIREREAQLKKEYEVLAAEAKALRDGLVGNNLVLRLAGGEEYRQPIGAMLEFYYPNQLGFFGKVSMFFHRMWNFVSQDPREANTEGGIFPAIFGTFVMTLLMSVAVTPFGVIAAVYLREYAKQGVVVQLVRISVNNLAGVPSIVYGVFGLGFFVYFVGGNIDHWFFYESLPTPTVGTGGIMWAALTLSLLTLPVVIVATEEALAAVSRGTREAALACGASKWQTIQRVVLPSAAPGILTGLILAMARGAGEVAPLMLVGVVKLAPSLPLDTTFPFIHPERKFMHLGFHIYDLGFQSPDAEAAKPMVFATTLLLITLVVVLNLGAIMIRNHLRKKYAAGTF
ncbi:phosphate ABC transporter permease PtsA [Verrucomicrobia bacterium LW23]|nr:phosphate ABC transporter permease PtsA [Verrucomicrobia bacterium LW23]